MKTDNEFISEIWRKVDLMEWMEMERDNVMKRNEALKKLALLKFIKVLCLIGIIFFLTYASFFDSIISLLICCFILGFIIFKETADDESSIKI